MSDLLSFWFPLISGDLKYQSFWFDGSKDKEIYDKYYVNLQEAEKLDINYILSLENNYKFYCLIMFDQITRNTARITYENPYRNDEKAMKISKNLLSLNYDLSIQFIKRIFILLPLRHSCKMENLDFVISRLNIYHDSLLETEKSDYQRFYIASLKNYTSCTENISIIKPSPQNIIYDESIHDSICKNYENIVSNNKIIDLNKNRLYQSVLNYCRKYKILKLGVSLSGGVDSMVLLFILRQMVLNNEIQNVVAVHIDYHWRKESTHEAQYLVHFCNHLGIDMVLRDIVHFNPDVDTKIDISRETIEEETKMIRFNTYKFAIEKYDLAGICLGHHKDDLIENVFMNMSRGKNLLDLFVTEEYSIQHEVYVLRPMLGHHKEDIIEVAHSNFIAYFKDTTPDWSFRGTMRRKIFPTMTDFDPMILNNFYRMGQQSAEWGGFIKNKIINPILKSAKKYKWGLSFEINIDYTNIPSVFWSELLANFFHSHGINMITQKNLGTFILWVERNNKNEKLRLSNGHLVLVNNNKFYFIKSELFEKIKNELCETKYEIKLSDFDDEINLKMSMWNIKIQKYNIFEENNMMSYEDILNGKFEYFVRISDKFTIGLGERNKVFGDVTLLTHLVPKISSSKLSDCQILKISYNNII
jgi:tRNA(Ile)-lysidine synthetase-like protein